jgi:hypothetical protein
MECYPAGAVSKAVARLFNRDPESRVRESLRRFKQLIETGEIITTVGQPAGRASSTSWKYDQFLPGRDLPNEPLKGRTATSR